MMETIRRYTNTDKVTLALILEEGRARATDLQFHLTLTRGQIKAALDRLVAQGAVAYEATTRSYRLL
jgi:predicted ArsR family transcriptional regulator